MDKNFVIIWIASAITTAVGLIGMSVTEALRSDYESCLDQRTREISRDVVNPINCECNP